MRARRTDANHTPIVRALRAAGCVVLDTSGCGDGFPDLVIGHAGRTILLEIKDGAKTASQRKLTPKQADLHRDWRGGPLVVATDIDGALRACGCIK